MPKLEQKSNASGTPAVWKCFHKIESAAISPDCRTVFYGRNGAIIQADTQTGQEFRFGATILRDFTFLSQGVFGELFSLKLLPLPQALTGVKFGYPIDLLRVSPDGRYLLSATLVSTRVWDIATGTEVVQQLRSENYCGHSVDAAFDGSGGQVAWAGVIEKGDGDRSWNNTTIYHVPGGQTLKKLGNRTGTFDHLAFSPDGRYLLTSRRRTKRAPAVLQAFDVSAEAELVGVDQEPIRRFEPFVGDLSKPAVTPDGRRVVCGDGDVVGVWDFETGQQVEALQLPPHHGRVTCVACLPDARRVVASDYHGTVHLWELGNAAPLDSQQGFFQSGVSSIMAGTMKQEIAVLGSVAYFWVVKD